MSQLVFGLPLPASYYADDFIISSANQNAVQLVNNVPRPDMYGAILSGPAASGKTHLARNWATTHQAEILSVSALGTTSSDQLWKKSPYAVLENIETIHDNVALFHLLRYAETQRNFLLMTASVPPQILPFDLPDVMSRLLAVPHATILPPDEEALQIFLHKYFSERQLKITEDVVAYMVSRIERSFAAARTAANHMEKQSLIEKREITIPFAKKVLAI